jgi:cytochrome c-type biogenesis protein CcmH/NrfF
MNNCPMGPACHGLKGQSQKLDAYLAKGMTRDQVRAAFVSDYGEPVLTEPIDKGFNRLAWFFPYLIGATGATAIGLVAWRWSRRPEQELPPAAVASADDRVLGDRLNDELRDLD